MVDFGALTATVALFLGLLDPSQSAENSHQRDSDRTMINGVLHTMEGFANNTNETIAAQSVNVIKSLLAIDQQSAGGNGENLRLTIPYFGTISIVRPASNQSSRTEDANPNMPVFPSPQSITVGQNNPSEPWKGINPSNHNPMTFPTVSFTSCQFNPMVPEQPVIADFGWADADTLYFGSLLNTDIDGNWMFQ